MWDNMYIPTYRYAHLFIVLLSIVATLSSLQQPHEFATKSAVGNFAASLRLRQVVENIIA